MRMTKVLALAILLWVLLGLWSDALTREKRSLLQPPFLTPVPRIQIPYDIETTGVSTGKPDTAVTDYLTANERARLGTINQGEDKSDSVSTEARYELAGGTRRPFTATASDQTGSPTKAVWEGASTGSGRVEEGSQPVNALTEQPFIGSSVVTGPTSLEVWKTVEALRTRSYDWSVTKAVQPATLALEWGESADLIYTIDVTRELGDDVYAVRGTLYAANDVENAAHLVHVVDCVEYRDPSNLGPEPGGFTTLTCETLQVGGIIVPGGSASWDYRIGFAPVPGANAYRNRAEVTISNHPDGVHTFIYRESFDLPLQPDGEQDVCATVTDQQVIPDGFVVTDDYPNGGWSACSSGAFVIHKTLTNNSAPPGIYNMVNSAVVVAQDSGRETRADAAVAVTVPPPRPTTLLLDPEAATNELPADTVHPFTATVLDQYGDPMTGVPVSFSTDFGRFVGGNQYAEILTGASGQAVVTVVSTTAGTAHIRAWIDDGDDAFTAGEVTDEPSVKTWVGDGPTVLNLHKTAEGVWARSYDWTVTKAVQPETLSLEVGESADLIYTIDVTRQVADDTFAVLGILYAANDVENAAHLVHVVDCVEFHDPTNPGPEPGGFATLTCQTLQTGGIIEPGAAASWDYRIGFAPVPGADAYRNRAEVTISNHPDGVHTFIYRESFDLPLQPDGEQDGCATVTDQQTIPDGFAATDDYPVGGWNPCSSDTFVVHRTLTNNSAPPGTHDLVNSVVVAGQDSGRETHADATVTITVAPPFCLRIRKSVDGVFTNPFDGQDLDLGLRTTQIHVSDGNSDGWSSRFSLTIEAENCGDMDLTNVQITDVIENLVAPREPVHCSGGLKPKTRPSDDDWAGLDRITWSIEDLPAGKLEYCTFGIETLRNPDRDDKYEPTDPRQRVPVNSGATVCAVVPGFGIASATTDYITLALDDTGSNADVDDGSISVIEGLPSSTRWAVATFDSDAPPDCVSLQH